MSHDRTVSAAGSSWRSPTDALLRPTPERAKTSTSSSAGPGPPASGPVVRPGPIQRLYELLADAAWSWHRHGNLFLIGQPDVAAAIAQNKADIAEELGLPGLVLDEGFLNPGSIRPAPGARRSRRRGLAAASRKRDALVWASPSSPLGMKLLAKAPGLAGARAVSGSHQARARATARSSPSRSRRERRLFAVLAEDAGDRRRFRELLAGLRDVVGRYDLHRGWFGTGTLLHSVTCHPGHPLEVIGQGLGQGNDWFTFSGYMDFLMREQLPAWLDKVGLRDVAVDVGTGKATHSLGTVAYGLPGLWRPQDPGHADRGGMDPFRQGPEGLHLPSGLRARLR